MKHENPNWQLTNLELSKKLCALGVPQKSEFYWAVINGYDQIEGKNTVRWQVYYSRFDAGFKREERISAFTESEIGKYFEKTEKFYQIETWFDFDTNKYRCILLKLIAEEYGEWENKEWFDDEEAVLAKSKMLIYLIENKLITL